MLEADYYDGKTARRHRIQLQITAGMVHIAGSEIKRLEPFDHLQISERMGSAPRLLRFPDGAYCEVRNHAQLATLLSQAGHRDGHVDRLQRSWLIALAALAIILASVVVAYLWGLPRLSAWSAPRMPAAWVTAISLHTEDVLEEHLLKPSTLAAERIRTLRQGFDALKGPHGRLPAHRLEFRSSPGLGPNAITLPDGTIILFDALVKLADNDQQIYAVIAHEMGHVQNYHGLRMLLQSAAVGTFTAWWFGDISSLLIVAPTAFLQARYSQAFEYEADAYSVALLKANGIPPVRLAEMLEKLSAVHGTSDGKLPEIADYLSSHPNSKARIQALLKAP